MTRLSIIDKNIINHKIKFAEKIITMYKKAIDDDKKQFGEIDPNNPRQSYTMFLHEVERQERLVRAWTAVTNLLKY